MPILLALIEANDKAVSVALLQILFELIERPGFRVEVELLVMMRTSSWML
jgi:hypothetical protein